MDMKTANEMLLGSGMAYVERNAKPVLIIDAEQFLSLPTTSQPQLALASSC
ncbi:hypothetical protein GGQ99_001282 [Aminobacter niigataensis]|uniref:Uncharacterized protein n=1 Tax=Aminobacter niigataensis TaxID=83265 RepID=A0ABR6L0I2_9HYPH|nr:hypothetical protein [Aminobacter niigataensis]MBB4649560.1 hypothetical protein [Aminobacter niigataensis]